MRTMFLALAILGWCIASALAAALIAVWLRFVRNAKRKCWCGKREKTAAEWDRIGYRDSFFIAGDGSLQALRANIVVHYHPNLRKQCEVI